MRKGIRKLIAFTLLAALLLQLIPASVFATEDESAISGDDILSNEQELSAAEDFADGDDLQNADILFEETSLREENVKHFRMSDGSYMAVGYDMPVHYLDTDGQWQDYDNTLHAVQKAGKLSGYCVENGDSLRFFAADVDADQLLTVQKGAYCLTLAPINAADAELPAQPIVPLEPMSENALAQESVHAGSMTDLPAADAVVLTAVAPAGADIDEPILAKVQPEKLYSALEYANAVNGAALRYENYANTVKESIVISAPQAEYTYRFRLQTVGLNPEVREDGSILLSNEDGEGLYSIPAPYMIDANDEYSDAAEYTLTAEGNAWILTVTADPAWMNQTNRAFPVLLDPTVTELELTDTVMSGGFVRSGYPNAPDPSDTGLYVGNNGNANGNTRAYFHINDLIDLPEGCELYYAGFAIYHYAQEYQTGGSDLEVGLYGMEKINGNFNSDMSAEEWRSFIAGLTWNSVTGTSNTHNSYITDAQTLSSDTAGDYVTWDLTALAHGWYDGVNLGFVLKPVDESNATSRAAFYGPKKPYNRPALILGYRNTVGIEGYYTYQSAGIGRAGTSSISDYTLQNTLSVPLISSDSTVLPFSLSLVYNSAYGARAFTAASDILHTKDFSGMLLGAGWKLSAQQTVVPITVGGVSYRVYTDADGTEHYFSYNSATGKYEDEDGLGLSITGSSDFTMTDRAGNTWYFAGGYLTYFKDAYGNKISYNYNSSHQLTSITRLIVGGSTETLATLHYTNGKLDSVTGENSKETGFTYATVQGINCLTAIRFPDGAEARYTYYDTSTPYKKARLYTAYDAEINYGMEYSYSYNKNVYSLYEYVMNGSTRVYGVKMHGFKRSHGLTVYRYYGDNGVAEEQGAAGDDILTYKVFDRLGRTINSYSTESTEEHVLGVGAANYTANSATSKKNNRITANVSSGLQGFNLLTNSGAENGTADWTNAATSTAAAYRGSNSFLLGASSLCQSVYLYAGKPYTLSAYVRVENSGGVRLAFQNGSQDLKTSNTVNYNTTGANNGWLRLTVSYEVSANGNYNIAATKTGTSGTVYVDCLQLEQEDSASTYNLIEDGSFEASETLPTASTYGWYRINSATAAEEDTCFGEKVLCLSGGGYNRALQNVPVNAPLESTFLISGWAKANADPDSVPEKEKDEDAYFGLIARLYYSDGSSEGFYFPFDAFYNGWQYRQDIIVPEKTGSVTITRILVAAVYDYNINTAYMDNISLRMEPVQSYRYDSNGNLIAATQTEAGTESAAYSGIDLRQYTSANGNKYSYTYNGKHDILTATAAGVTNTYTYDAAGNPLTSKLTGTGSAYLYSSQTPAAGKNHIASATDVNGNTTTYAYNEKTEQLESTTTDGITVNYGYNTNNGRPTITYQSGVAAINYTYGGGLLTQLDRKTFRGGSEQHQYYNFAFNRWGQKESVKVGSTLLASYEYEDISTTGLGGGNLAKMTYGNGASVSYSYDNLDRLIKTVYNDTGNYVQNFYNAEGALSALAYYSSAGSLLNSCEFEYDSLGRLIRSTEQNAGGLVQRTEHTYDAYNRLSSQKWVLGSNNYSESYTYNDGESGNGSLKTMTTATGDKLSFTYDTLNRLARTTATAANGTAILNTAYSYRTVSGNQSSAQVEYRNVRLGSATDDTLVEGKKYSYDDRGNITAIAESVSPYRTLTAYTYDSQNQLLSETYYTYSGTATTPATTTVYSYTYDTAGNIVSEKKNGTVTKNYTYGNSQWKDLLTAYGVKKIAYEGQTYNDTTNTVSGTAKSGNPIYYYNGRMIYSEIAWQNGRQMTSVTLKSPTSATLNIAGAVKYSYDAEGIRVSKAIPTRGRLGIINYTTHNYITQNGKVVRETIGSGSTAEVLDFIYDESGRPFALNYSTNNGSSFNTYYYITNLQGDVVKLIHYIPGFEYKEVANYTYDAWGNVLSSSGSMASINPLRYRGYYYDTETGFYYLQSRYYDPMLRRFINADSYASTDTTDAVSCNMFAYCLNNPVNAADPTGHDSSTDTNGNGIPDYLEIRWIRMTISASKQLGSNRYSCSDDGKYIYDQENCGYSNWALGDSTVANCGCGIVAAYNILLSRGKTSAFAEVYLAAMYLNALYTDADGHTVGTTVDSILPVLVLFDPTMTNAGSEQSAQSIFIVYGYYENGEWTGGHAACAISDGAGSFIMYNAIGAIRTTFYDYEWFFNNACYPYCQIDDKIYIG